VLSNAPWVTRDRLQSVLQLDGSMLRSMNAKSVSHSVLEELWELWKGLSGVDSSFLLLAVGVGRIGETSYIIVRCTNSRNWEDAVSTSYHNY